MTIPRALSVSGYVSGHCGIGHHDHCTGTYAGATCNCSCHVAPRPSHLVCPTCGGTGRIERSAA